jgi:hypothetical protein
LDTRLRKRFDSAVGQHITRTGRQIRNSEKTNNAHKPETVEVSSVSKIKGLTPFAAYGKIALYETQHRRD